MIDFQNASYLEFGQVPVAEGSEQLNPLLVEGEELFAAFKGCSTTSHSARSGSGFHARRLPAPTRSTGLGRRATGLVQRRGPPLLPLLLPSVRRRGRASNGGGRGRDRPPLPLPTLGPVPTVMSLAEPNTVPPGCRATRGRQRRLSNADRQRTEVPLCDALISGHRADSGTDVCQLGRR
jgi:hypothetical protein